MRIAYIHQYYRNLQMPGGTRSFELARRLVGRGHEVHLITTETTGSRRGLSWLHTRNDDGIDVHWFSVPYSNHMSYARRIRAFGEFAIAAAAKATALRPDLVLATSTPLTVAIPGMVASRLRRVPFVFEVRDLWPEVPIEMGILRNPVAKFAAGALATLAYRNAAEVVALSPGMAQGVTARSPGTPTTVVPNASDLELFSTGGDAARLFRASQDWLRDRPLVVYVGTLGTVNGVGYLVRLAAAVRKLDSDVRFLIVGDGKEWRQTRTLAAEFGVLDTTLRIWPEMPKADVPAILSAATIATSVCLPLPCLQHNCANKFFDALAAGRPIVINYGGWQRDLLSESGAGLMLDPYDIGGAAATLVRHLRDDVWLARAGAAARRLAVDRFSRDLLFDRFHAVLARAAAGGPPRYSRRGHPAREAARGAA
ncbi:MAG TPA: glycosyltransferase family 4 protein [Pilimelia sp.]|nr:glycosyltransferase family 4 protein [Pilimelia sp.]